MRWIHRLHGAQLMMLLALLGALAFAGLGGGVNLSKEATADYLLGYNIGRGNPEYGPKDTSFERVMKESAAQKHSVANWFLLGGAVFAIAGVAVLWSWFGSRRKASP
jgi:hypothetical protein